MANNENIEIYEGEVTEVETQEIIPVETDEAEDAGLSTAAAMLIGGAITAGVIWAVGKAKKLIAAHKAKKAAAEAAEEEYSEDDLEPAEEIEEA